MKTTTKLRNLLKEDKLIVAPFILNALHAKIAEEVGFEAVYMTGCGTAAERGFTDVGLLTMTEMVANAKYIAQAVDIPVICDADTGYGNPINVRRTVREYEMAGVAGIHLEDQVFPKKCGFFEGKQVIPMEEHVQKIKAALDARTDPDFVIIASHKIPLTAIMLQYFTNFSVKDHLTANEKYWHARLVDKKELKLSDLFKEKIDLTKYPFNTEFFKELDL